MFRKEIKTSLLLRIDKNWFYYFFVLPYSLKRRDIYRAEKHNATPVRQKLKQPLRH